MAAFYQEKVKSLSSPLPLFFDGFPMKSRKTLLLPKMVLTTDYADVLPYPAVIDRRYRRDGCGGSATGHHFKQPRREGATRGD